MTSEQARKIDLANLSAEAAVLGSIMFDNGVFDRVIDTVGPSDFFAPVHQEIYTACKQLIQSGRVANGVSLREKFESDEQLTEVGGAQYLAELLDSAAFGPEVVDYARIVHSLAQRRRLKASSEQMAEDSHIVDIRPEELLTKARETLDWVESHSLIESDTVENVRDAVGEMLGEVGDLLSSGKSLPVGVSTGFAPLDKQIARMHHGDLIVIAGRPSMGKTSLATNIATNAKIRNDEGGDEPARVAFFSLEMDRKQMGFRVASQMARRHGEGVVPYRDLRAGSIGQNEYAILLAGISSISPRLFMDTEAQITVDKICARAKAKKRDMGGLDLIVVDYLQITGDVLASDRNRVQVVGQVTGRLKALAKELNCPVVLLSQLSRDVEKRDDKRPQLSDLRDSGSIEQDADVVIFVYRHEYYLARQEPNYSDQDKWGQWKIDLTECEGRMDAIVSKNRHGDIGTVSLFAELKTDCVVEDKSQLKEEDLFHVQ